MATRVTASSRSRCPRCGGEMKMSMVGWIHSSSGSSLCVFPPPVPEEVYLGRVRTRSEVVEVREVFAEEDGPAWRKGDRLVVELDSKGGAWVFAATATPDARRRGIGLLYSYSAADTVLVDGRKANEPTGRGRK